MQGVDRDEWRALDMHEQLTNATHHRHQRLLSSMLLDGHADRCKLITSTRMHGHRVHRR